MNRNTQQGEGRKIRDLFLTFLKIGAFTFGGGYAMIPLIKEEVVTHHKWVEEKDILDITAIAESTPGPIAINAATFIGYKVDGFAGAFASTVGVALPSFVIIFALSFVLAQFEHLRIVKYAFAGIRVGVLALIINACVSMYKQCSHDLLSYALMAMAFGLVAFAKVSVLYVILISAVIGLTVTMLQGSRVRERHTMDDARDGSVHDAADDLTGGQKHD